MGWILLLCFLSFCWWTGGSCVVGGKKLDRIPLQLGKNGWRERERGLHECTIVWSLHICTDCLRQESSYSNCVGETSKGSWYGVSEGLMGAWGGGGGGRERERERELVTWFPGMRKSFSSNILSREHSKNVLAKFWTNILPVTIMECSLNVIFNNVLLELDSETFRTTSWEC